MTTTEMVEDVADLCNVSGPSAEARILRSLNERNRQVCTRVGISHDIVRTTTTAVTTPNVRTLTYGPTPISVIKVVRVYDATVNPYRFLAEVSHETLMERMQRTVATEYAIETSGSRSVTILLDYKPANADTWTAEVETNATKLSGNLSPAFTEEFHDILTYYAKSIEYTKKTDTARAKQFFELSEKRMGELTYFLTISARKTMQQASRGPMALMR